jgi:hypothetical protein
VTALEATTLVVQLTRDLAATRRVLRAALAYAHELDREVAVRDGRQRRRIAAALESERSARTAAGDQAVE